MKLRLRGLSQWCLRTLDLLVWNLRHSPIGPGVKPHGWRSGRGRSTAEGHWVHERDQLYKLLSCQQLFKSAVRTSERECIELLAWILPEELGAVPLKACCMQSSKGETEKGTNFVMNKKIERAAKSCKIGRLGEDRGGAYSCLVSTPLYLRESSAYLYSSKVTCCPHIESGLVVAQQIRTWEEGNEGRQVLRGGLPTTAGKEADGGESCHLSCRILSTDCNIMLIDKPHHSISSPQGADSAGTERR